MTHWTEGEMEEMPIAMFKGELKDVETRDQLIELIKKYGTKKELFRSYEYEIGVFSYYPWENRVTVSYEFAEEKGRSFFVRNKDRVTEGFSLRYVEDYLSYLRRIRQHENR